MKRGTRKTMSPAQLDANRRNAQKSTGPKTAEGKAIAKMNALKHGLLAQTVVVRGHKIKESPHVFRKLCQEFYTSLAPVGPLEETLVQQMVQASWRLRRARTAESGEIALNVDEGHEKRSRINPTLQWALWETWGDPVPAMRESALGNSILIKWLQAVRTQVERHGELTDDAIKIPFHGKPNKLATDLEKLRQQFPSAPPEGVDATAHREAMKAKLLSHLNEELRLLDWCKEGCEKYERSVESARQAAAVLPSEATLDKIMRYEASLERQLYRAMNQLERLQRQRAGEVIPAPLTMEVSARG